MGRVRDFEMRDLVLNGMPLLNLSLQYSGIYEGEEAEREVVDKSKEATFSRHDKADRNRNLQIL